MSELREENSLLSIQLASAQNVIAGDKESDERVDKNANLQMTRASDERLSSDSDQLRNIEPAEQQVVTLFRMLGTMLSFVNTI